MKQTLSMRLVYGLALIGGSFAVILFLPPIALGIAVVLLIAGVFALFSHRRGAARN